MSKIIMIFKKNVLNINQAALGEYKKLYILLP